jgi:hypothetical protein
VETSISLWEPREVSAGRHRHHQHFGVLDFLKELFGNIRLGQLRFGNLFSGENVALTNTAVNIAVIIGGGSIAQVTNQSNVV